MSDLQLGLLGIGACFVAGVYAFNCWQEREFRRRADAAFAREHDDVLMPEESVEPAVAPDTRVEPSLAATEPQPAAPGFRAPTARTPAAAGLDAVIDYVVEVEIGAPVPSAGLHEELAALAAAWHKPVMVSGYDAATGAWQAAGMNSGDYAQLRFAVQMSNRAGCIGKDQLSAFRAAVQKWANAQGGKVKCLETDLAHAMAVQIDRFCADVDIAIGINVVTHDTSPFSGTKIRALAEAAGLKLESDGIFYLRSDNGHTIYTLDNHEPMPFMPEQIKTLTTGGVTFLLDVPRVADAVRAFESMLTAARSFAASLGGRLVDDNRTGLSEEAIEKIRRQLAGILAKMEAGQIPAGGARALRLFA